MKYEAKTYKRLGAMTGSIVGVLLMIIAVCIHKTVLGAILLVVCACVGVIIGNITENKICEKKQNK